MEELKELLKKSGFHNERVIDITPILKLYQTFGYEYNELQINFMEKYADLEIHYTHPVWNEKIVLRINPIEAQKIITMDIIEEYNKFLQDSLLIIGDIERENLTLFLSQKGTFYTAFDDCIINWGNNFETMLNKLITGTKGEFLIME